MSLEQKAVDAVLDMLSLRHPYFLVIMLILYICNSISVL